MDPGPLPYHAPAMPRCSLRTAAIFGAALLTPAAGRAEETGAVVDRLVAAIGGKPLTLSELEFETRVAFIRQGGIRAADAALDDALLGRVLDLVIVQWLILAEVERLRVDEADEEEVQREARAFAQQFETPAAYRAFLARQDVTDATVAAIVRRELRVARYMERRVRLLARVEDAEVRRHLALHPDEVRGLDEREAFEAVRQKLSRDNAARVTRREMDEIRRRGDVRVVARFPRPSDAPAAAGKPSEAP